MKKHLFFAACLATALFSACSNNEVEQLTSNEGTKVSFAINRDVARATLDAADGKLTLAANDKVGVISTGLTTNIENALFTVTAEGTLTPPTGTSYTFDQTASFYAYFPSSDADNVTVNGGNTAVTFTVKSDQSAEVNYLASDFITASASDQNPTNEAIQLTFGHRLTLVKVALTGFDSPTSVTLNQVKPTATWTISDNQIAVSGSATDIKMWNNTTTNEYWAIVPAQTIAQNAVMFIIEANGKHYTYAPTSDIELTANSPKKFTLTLQPETKTVVLSTALISSWGTEAENVAADVEKMNYVMAPTSLSDLIDQGKAGLTTNGEWGIAFGTVGAKTGSGEATLNENKSISIKKTAAGHWSCNTIFYYGEAPKVNTGKQYLLTFNVSCDIANKQITVAMMTANQSGSFCAIKDGETYYGARLYKCVTENETYQVSMVIDCTKIAGTGTSSTTPNEVGEAKDQNYYLLFYPNETDAMFTISNICLTEQ